MKPSIAIIDRTIDAKEVTWQVHTPQAVKHKIQQAHKKLELPNSQPAGTTQPFREWKTYCLATRVYGQRYQAKVACGVLAFGTHGVCTPTPEVSGVHCSFSTFTSQHAPGSPTAGPSQFCCLTLRTTMLPRSATKVRTDSNDPLRRNWAHVHRCFTERHQSSSLPFL